MKKKIIVVSLLLGLIIFGCLMSGLHIKEINTIPGDVKEIRSTNIGDYGKALDRRR